VICDYPIRPLEIFIAKTRNAVADPTLCSLRCAGTGLLRDIAGACGFAPLSHTPSNPQLSLKGFAHWIDAAYFFQAAVKTKLPEEMVSVLEEHCEKLVNIENTLYELSISESGDLKSIELWMQSQSQLRITMLELQKQKYPAKK
jgi:hypothetical protein